MNQVVEEMKEYLMHVGVSINDGAPVGSGRYPFGSGKNPHQHEAVTFASRVKDLRKQNFTFKDPEDGKTYSGDSAIARALGLKSTTQLRVEYALAEHERKNLLRSKARTLIESGMSKSAAARELGVGESTLRSLLDEERERRQNQAIGFAEELKKAVDEHGMVDIGEGIEKALGCSKERLKEAVYILEREGYNTYVGGIPTGPGHQTNMKVLATPDTPHRDLYNYKEVYNLASDKVSHDGGDTFDPTFVYPASMDSKRIKINYAEDGGLEKDGLVELRRNVPDLSLGNSKYAQVRILVDGTHYVKGMAVYSDNMPDGVDLVFNTNKKRGTPKMDVLKSAEDNLKKNPNNPFGSLIKSGIIDPNDPTKREGGQSYYYDENGKKHLSLINKRAEEGDWGEWADKLSSQFLAKQPKKMVQTQLDLTYADKVKEYEEYKQLDNPTLKKAFLNQFADDCDSSAVHLKAAALPRQKWQVLIPLTSTKDNEIYAPNYENGETVALVRYPHAGTFEIPILKVNNRNPEGKRVLSSNPQDAVGINSKVAERLSGADFDGDTVMVIPCNSPKSNVHVMSTPPLQGLVGFDPKLEYGPRIKNNKKIIDYKLMTESDKQKKMGEITNLIADMTILGAPPQEMERAVKHSMVVIDAVKHKLDYQRSAKENKIQDLKKTYQGRINPKTGRYTQSSSTLITRAKSEVTVDKRKSRPIINEDGSLTWETADPKRLYYKERAPIKKRDANGKLVKDADGKQVFETDPTTGKRLYEYTGKIKTRNQKSTQMAETKDAYELVSKFAKPVELQYADYANKLKALANTARKEMISTKDRDYDKAASKVYDKEVKRMKSEIAIAEYNAPFERKANAIAASEVKAVKAENPDITKSEVKKLRAQFLERARLKVGAKRHTIEITDKDWEAIQAGAINKTTLNKIIKYADIDKLKERATPRTNSSGLSAVQIARIKQLAARGYTNEQIAKSVGVSASTVSKNLK